MIYWLLVALVVYPSGAFNIQPVAFDTRAECESHLQVWQPRFDAAEDQNRYHLECQMHVEPIAV